VASALAQLSRLCRNPAFGNFIQNGSHSDSSERYHLFIIFSPAKAVGYHYDTASFAPLLLGDYFPPFRADSRHFYSNKFLNDNKLSFNFFDGIIEFSF